MRILDENPDKDVWFRFEWYRTDVTPSVVRGSGTRFADGTVAYRIGGAGSMLPSFQEFRSRFPYYELVAAGVVP